MHLYPDSPPAVPESLDSLPTLGALLGLPNRAGTPLEEENLGLVGLFWLPPDPEDESDVCPTLSKYPRASPVESCAFRQELVEALLNHSLECEAVGVTPDAVDRYRGHDWIRFSKQGRYKWCRICPKDNMTKRRKVLGDSPSPAFSLCML